MPKNTFTRSFGFAFPVIILLLFSCSPGKDGLPEEGEASQVGVMDMPALLVESRNTIDMNRVPYLFNQKRASQIKNLMDQAEGAKKLEYQFAYAREMINAGKPDRAIREFEGIRKFLLLNGYRLPPEQEKTLLKNLALAYLRLGEQQNCFANNAEGSCIVPIQTQAIHNLKSGSESAIALYNEILEKWPDDFASMWLMNLCHMTLGSYPERIQEKWRIDPAVFHSKPDFPKFRNIAPELGVADDRLSGGCVVDDLNNDGWPDIAVTSWALDHPMRVFWNNEGKGFSEMKDSSGLSGIVGGLNMIQADYDNDGFLDLLVLRGAWLGGQGKIPNSLLRNNGDGTFSDVTRSSGILSFHPTQAAAWTDIDRNGWVDLVIANESTPGSPYPFECFMNQGDGTFKEQAKEFGLNQQGWAKGITCGDINNDGWEDLYISFFDQQNLLLLHNGESDPARIRFKDIAQEAGVTDPKYSFPTWIFDFNNDGWEDIFVSGYGKGMEASTAQVARNLMGQRVDGGPALYLNLGDGTFQNASEKLGLTDVIFTMGCNFGDLNQDGFLDFYLTTGTPDFASIYPNRMFLNQNGRHLADVTWAGGFGHIQKGHAVGFGDIDNDGDEDIYHVIGGAYEGDFFQNALYENPYNGKNNWVQLKLEGTTSNRAAIGARVEVVATDPAGKEHHFFRTVSWGSSFGANSLQLDLGLGACTQIDQVIVQWPNTDHTRERFTGIPIRNKTVIREGAIRK